METWTRNVPCLSFAVAPRLREGQVSTQVSMASDATTKMASGDASVGLRQCKAILHDTGDTRLLLLEPGCNHPGSESLRRLTYDMTSADHHKGSLSHTLDPFGTVSSGLRLGPLVDLTLRGSQKPSYLSSVSVMATCTPCEEPCSNLARTANPALAQRGQGTMCLSLDTREAYQRTLTFHLGNSGT